MAKKIYLDYAAATPVDERVLGAMLPYFEDKFYNPSATYLSAKKVAGDIIAARGRVAHWLGSKPAEIIFTAGGSEANNLAIQGVMNQLKDANVVVSGIEHESVLAPAHLYACREAPVTADGLVKLEELKKLIDDKTALVSVMYANNEVGSIQPIRQIAKIISEVKKDRQSRNVDMPLYFHADAAQAANYLNLHVNRLGVDLMTLNGGKIYGPKQSGVLFVGAWVGINPLIFGGGQERGLRSGTENIPGVVGLAKALDLAQSGRDKETKRLQNLQKEFISLLKQYLPDVVINGSLKHRLPNNVHVTLPGSDNERLLFALDEAGIMAAAGSACSASSEEASHVLAAMGLTKEEAYSSLRFTMGRKTTLKDVEQTVKTLAGIVA